MTLSNLIRKGGLGQIATATSATLATHEPASAATVASVATVAVAEPKAPAVAMTREEETTIRAWLVYIKETDMNIIAHVLNQCGADVEARAYFLRRAEEVPRPVPENDDRRHCVRCANLAPSGLCLAAQRGEIIASRTCHPADHIPRRCEGYAPLPNDPDQRTGRQRWPSLDTKRGNNGS